MSFLGLALKNLLRQRTRTLLTVVGIAIGIATVVALGAITSGFRATSGEFVTAGGADFVVAQNGASDLSFSTVAAADWHALERRPDVARASGILIEITRVGDRPYFPFFGYGEADLASPTVELVRGRLPGPGTTEVALGTQGAQDAGAGIGDTLTAKEMRFRVVGIYRARDTLRDAGGIVPLAAAQRLAGKGDVVTAVHVTLAPGAAVRTVAASIEAAFPQLATVTDVDEYSKIDQGLKILDSMNLAISLLAVGIGAIGVMNTMIMSVFERTREFGILRAVGWRGSRILRLVVTESLLLCLIAAGVGVGSGVAASRLVLLVPSISSFLTPAYGAQVFERALAVGIVVALAGAIYPAIRAVRLSPMEALRHE